MNLADLQLEVAEWALRNFPENTNNVHRPLLGVVEEVGELCHAHLKDEQGIRGTADEHHAAKSDAVGDILIYLANYCAISGLSLAQCAEHAWAEVKARDWKANPRDGKPRDLPGQQFLSFTT